MKSLIVKRSVVIAGHKTSISLEDPFWKALKEIAALRQVPLSNLVASVDLEREHANLSSAVRLFILDCCRVQFGGPAVARDLPREDAVMYSANSA